jgi:SAM-dependent methyltransferase
MGGFLQVAEGEYDVEGIDVSRFAIRSLRSHFGCRVRACNIEQWPAPKNKYDVIAVFNILEHLRQPQVVVAKMKAALSEDGVFIGSVPNNSGIVGKLVTRVGNFFDRTHVSTFTPSTWWGIFREAGFSTIRFFGEVTVGRNRGYYFRTKDWHQYSFNLMFLCTKEVRID